MERTPNNNLPYIIPQQAQKHVTHNEAIRALDTLVQLSFISIWQNPNTLSPQEGDTYIIGAAGEGVFSGKENLIAAFQDGDWIIYTPKKGWIGFNQATEKLVYFDGIEWLDVPSAIDEIQNHPVIGVNATADQENRFALSSAASLFTHEGSDHRLKINKSQSSQTASVLFQTDYVGRAEMGTSGNDDFTVKVADSEGQWRDALSIDHETGKVDFPQGSKNPTLHGIPESLIAFDRLYLDAINGNDDNDGLTAQSALKSFSGLAGKFSVGRKLELRLLSDINADHLIVIGYVVSTLNVFGRSSDDSGWENRKITVVDAANNANHPGGFMFQAFANVYTYKTDVELATSKAYALFNFYNTIGYLRTHTMTLTRTGTGNCCLFANGTSFVPNFHTSLVVDASADGYVANGIGAGDNPNSDWRYPSNVNSY